MLDERAAHTHLVVAPAVQEDLRTVGLAAEQIVHERAVPIERPGAVPVGDHQQRIAGDAELVEQRVDLMQRVRVRRRDVMDCDQQVPLHAAQYSLRGRAAITFAP